MYDPSGLWDRIFNFTETESINANFDRMGLDNTNFLYLLGRMGSDLVLTIFIYQIFNSIQYICAKFYYNPYARYIGMNIL